MRKFASLLLCLIFLFGGSGCSSQVIHFKPLNAISELSCHSSIPFQNVSYDSPYEISIIHDVFQMQSVLEKYSLPIAETVKYDSTFFTENSMVMIMTVTSGNCIVGTEFNDGIIYHLYTTKNADDVTNYICFTISLEKTILQPFDDDLNIVIDLNILSEKNYANLLKNNNFIEF